MRYGCKVKALDIETKQVVTYDCAPCPVCGRWIVLSSQTRYCEYCGARISADFKTLEFKKGEGSVEQLSMLK
jgi:hypothetical protein